jgi:hypothetical protein
VRKEQNRAEQSRTEQNRTVRNSEEEKDLKVFIVVNCRSKDYSRVLTIAIATAVTYGFDAGKLGMIE